MNGKLPAGAPAGLHIASFVLTVRQDLVSLRRRTRAAADDMGLPERTTRGLSAAAFDAASVIFEVAGVAEAELLVAEGPILQVIVRATSGHLEDVRRAVASSLDRLRALVDRLSIEDSAEGVAVALSVPLAAAQVERLPPRSALVPLGAVAPQGSELEEQNAELQRALRELQAELEETNRGVVALYAELEGQAERLRQAEDRLRVLLDSVQDYAICMLDARGEVASWNSGAQRLFSYTADEIIGRSFACFYTARERDDGLPAEHLAAALAQGRFEVEGLRVRNGGSAFDAHVLLTAVRGADQQLRGFSLVVRDVTERKRLEDDLRRRAEDLAAANRAKEDFLATLSHELRTPLNAMLGWTRLLRMGKLDPAAMSRALETIERNARAQEQLIADILDVSRIVTGKLRLELRPVHLEPIVDAAMDAVRPAADAKRIALACEMQSAGSVLGDPDRLQQVVWNLLSNAIKFTPAGGRVTVTLHRAGPSAAITVADTGEGMPPALLPFVFDRFTQGDGSVTRPHGGLGLGLSIVRHIVELHGGQVHAWSDGPGRGSRFSVHLPIRAVQAVAAPARTSSHPLVGLKVLVVDDDEDTREIVAIALTECGAQTRVAGSTHEALHVLSEFRPDVLVSDIGMPGEDGYALIRRVRALGGRGLADVPAIALTAFVHADDRRRALMAGFQKFVPKPVEADELAAVISSVAQRA